jgi:murein DD-endopeptidase MepM/ murein hydrolase activator NlpD
MIARKIPPYYTHNLLVVSILHTSERITSQHGVDIEDSAFSVRSMVDCPYGRMALKNVLMKPDSSRARPFLVLLVLFLATLACARPVQPGEPSFRVPGQPEAQAAPLDVPDVEITRTPFHPLARQPGDPILTPTPDAPRQLPDIRREPEQYVIQPGDTLGIVALRYGVSLDQLIEANELANPNLLEVGQVINVPAPNPQGQSPAFKIIPDSELVYGPASADFDIQAFVRSQGGYLVGYSEEVDEKTLSGVQIVQRVASDFSVNPRLLLAVLQYQSEWLTRTDIREGKQEYPIGVRESWRAGLYRQLAWAANNLNRGYYLWKANAVSAWLLADGTLSPVAPTINAGTAGVQQMFALLYGRADWELALGEKGLFATYYNLFGYPFDYAIEPPLPGGLRQPPMQLPFEPGVVWSFTGGPHGGWGDGSAWAALDFAPPMEALGCNENNEWVTAVTDGLVVRSGEGVVIQDLDGDGVEQTGWTVLYLHIATQNRIPVGAELRAGERIGHPSCEGGLSNGTHVHLARRYNGEWIPADRVLPFILDGWVARGAGKEYDGFLERNGQSVEAWDEQRSENLIQR